MLDKYMEYEEISLELFQNEQDFNILMGAIEDTVIGIESMELGLENLNSEQDMFKLQIEADNISRLTGLETMALPAPEWASNPTSMDKVKDKIKAFIKKVKDFITKVFSKIKKSVDKVRLSLAKKFSIDNKAIKEKVKALKDIRDGKSSNKLKFNTDLQLASMTSKISGFFTMYVNSNVGTFKEAYDIVEQSAMTPVSSIFDEDYGIDITNSGVVIKIDSLKKVTDLDKKIENLQEVKTSKFSLAYVKGSEIVLYRWGVKEDDTNILETVSLVAKKPKEDSARYESFFTDFFGLPKVLFLPQDADVDEMISILEGIIESNERLENISEQTEKLVEDDTRELDKVVKLLETNKDPNLTANLFKAVNSYKSVVPVFTRVRVNGVIGMYQLNKVLANMVTRINTFV